MNILNKNEIITMKSLEKMKVITQTYFNIIKNYSYISSPFKDT